MKKYIAECIGTFILVLLGCGTAVAANTLVGSMGLTVPLGFTTLCIAVAFGAAMTAVAYAFGSISGGHVNPAVSLGMLVAGRMRLPDCLGYLVAQFLGGLAGAWVLSILMGSRTSLGQNGYGSSSALGIDMITAMVIECILTFVFVLVVLEVTGKKKYTSVAGLVIGLTLTAIHLFGIPFTGTSVNPARSLGPALLAGGTARAQMPVFIVAPLAGGILAALVYRALMHTEQTKHR